MLRFPLTLALAVPLLSAQDHARPPVFQDLSLEQALALSSETGKLLVLDAMTAWCGPCKVMDRTTWVEPELVAWLEEHAIAIQLDMDRHPAVRERYAIDAYPTVLALRDGILFDRIVGLRDATFLKDWLIGVAAGRNAADQAEAELARLRADGPPRAHFARRAALLGRLVDATAFDLALEEALALWNDRPEEPDARGLEALHASLVRLARADAPARAALGELRDALEGRATAAAPDRAALADWLLLNAALRDTDRTARWAEAAVDTEAGARLLRELGTELFETLIARGAWRAAGTALSEPVQRLRDRRDLIAGDRPRSMPAIPLAPRRAPAAADSDGAPDVTPAIPLAPPPAARPADTGASDAAPKVVPAIPLAPRQARPAGDAPKVTPAIPLAPRAAQPSEGVEGDAPKAIPAIPLAPRGRAAPDRAPEDGEPTWTNPSDPEARDREIRARIRYEFRQQCADVYAALLAAGRLDEAAEVADVLLGFDASARARCALVGRALEAGAIGARQEAHQRWLDEVGR